MISINVYHYNSVVKNFTIFAPLKHGTRWLSTTGTKSRSTLFSRMTTTENISLQKDLILQLFEEQENPYGYSNIKLKKFKRKLKIENPVFVYRDPYECFVKAILTAVGDEFRQWDGNVKDLYIMMVDNGHFSPTLWRDVSEVLEQLDDECSVEFVELRQLSNYVTLNTLKYYPYNFDKYSFENYILTKFGYTTDEIIELCKTHHPTLWNNFMIQIEKETEALNKLLEKFKWNEK